MHATTERTRLRTAARAGGVLGGLVLGIALVARFYVGEPDWISTMAQTGSLLVGFGLVIELVARQRGEAAYRAGMALALFTVLLLGWVNGAVGIIGSEDNRANLMYGGVLLVGVVGTLVARLRPAGMGRALIATAAAQALVAVIATVGRMGAPYSGPMEILITNAFFVVLFSGAAALFLKSAAASKA